MPSLPTLTACNVESVRTNRFLTQIKPNIIEIVLDELKCWGLRLMQRYSLNTGQNQLQPDCSRHRQSEWRCYMYFCSVRPL